MIEQRRYYPSRKSKRCAAACLQKVLRNHPVGARLLLGTDLKG